MSVGVLTDPVSLGEYERAVPGSGVRILDQFFEQARIEAANQKELAHIAIKAEIAQGDRALSQADRGQTYAFIVAITGFLCVCFLAYIQQPHVAGLVAVLDIGALVSAFIYGKKKQTEESKILAQKEAAEASAAEAASLDQSDA